MPIEAAGIARFATASGTPDLTDPNSYPIDAGGIGTTMVAPQGLVDQGVKNIASIRVDIPAASALIGIYEDIYADDGVEFVADIPVPAGTTDYSQFILGGRAGRRRGRHHRPGWPGGDPGAARRAAARLRPAHLGQPRDLPLPRTWPSSATSPSRWSSTGRASPPPRTSRPWRCCVADLAASGDEELAAAEPQGDPDAVVDGPLRAPRRSSGRRAPRTSAGPTSPRSSRRRGRSTCSTSPRTGRPTPTTRAPSPGPGTATTRSTVGIPTPSSRAPTGTSSRPSELDFNALVCGSPIGAPAETC